jgi:hypothetical protein
LKDEIEKAQEKAENNRDYQTIACLCQSIGNICCAGSSKIVDNLTGFCWDEEEAGMIKRYLLTMPNIFDDGLGDE